VIDALRPVKPVEGWTFHAHLPSLCNVVRCWFPVEDPKPNDELKLRRGLILETKTLDGLPFVTVAHGTGNLKLGSRAAVDLIISDRPALSRLGLSKPTRFDLDRIEQLPWCVQYFPSPKASKQLNADEVELLLARLSIRGWR
jgi:hypothetical protein